MSKFKTWSHDDFWAIVFQKYATDFPNLDLLGRIYLTQPPTTVDAERGFIYQNLIKTALRTKLSPKAWIGSCFLKLKALKTLGSLILMLLLKAGVRLNAYLPLTLHKHLSVGSFTFVTVFDILQAQAVLLLSAHLSSYYMIAKAEMSRYQVRDGICCFIIVE